MDYRISNGILSSGIILYNDNMYISSGGAANDTTVNFYSYMHVGSGGKANNTTVNTSGWLKIYNCGVAAHTTIQGGNMSISSGGVANSTTVNTLGNMYIESFGFASNTTVNAGGSMSISGGTATGTTVSSSGYIGICSGGEAKKTTVNSSGRMLIFSGGTAADTAINAGEMDIRSGVADSTTVNYAGRMLISSGGSANNTTLNNGGRMCIYSGGAANNTTANQQGQISVSSGGVINNTILNSGGDIELYSGGAAYDTTVNSGCFMDILSGGTATGIIAQQGATLDIEIARDTFIQGTYNGSSFEMKDARISGYNMHQGGDMRICSGATATDTSVNVFAGIYVDSGGCADNTKLSSQGCMNVSSGGTANNTTVNSGGQMSILNGGTATDVNISGTGVVKVSGRLSKATVTSGQKNRLDGGDIAVYNSGIAEDIKVSDFGDLFISSGGCAKEITILDNGRMVVYDNAVAGNVICHSGGIITMWENSLLSGNVEISGKMAVDGRCDASKANISLSLKDRTTADDYIVTGFNNLILNNISISVSANQECGAYKLAQGAGNFRGAISVGDGSISYGNLSVNGTALKYNDLFYKLTLSGGNLHLSVDRAVVPVTDSPATDIKNRGFSQVIAWDKNRGTVGMIHNDGSSPAAWGGVWEWSGSDINLWRVAGAGHFKGSKVDYDGVLLYNGIGNTFAAWTDLNDPSYGYVDLCHVEGSFNTRAIADFDGNNYDDILIFDDKGSFGTVLDGTTYKDIWHVDNPASNPWKVLGAGSFGGAADKLIVENSSNGHLYLWQNNDSSFKTWDWSQTDIGYLGDSKFMVSGDFNGDGTDDIVIQKSNGEMWCWDDGNSANLRWIGNLDSTFAVESVGDYNADGKEDILLREQSSGWGGLGFWGAGYAGNWTDMNVRIETDTRISGSKFAIIA